MIKVDSIQFTQPVLLPGGAVTQTINSDARGAKFEAGRDENAQTFYVVRLADNHTIALPRTSVLWWHDAPGDATPAKGRTAMKQQGTAA